MAKIELLINQSINRIVRTNSQILAISIVIRSPRETCDLTTMRLAQVGRTLPATAYPRRETPRDNPNASQSSNPIANLIAQREPLVLQTTIALARS